MTDPPATPPPDPDRAAELVVIERLLRPARFHRLAPAGALVRVGDTETEYAIADFRGQGQFEERQRGAVNEILTASSVDVALRFLTYRLAELARPTWWPIIQPAEYAPGAELERVEDGQRLVWADDWLHFPRRTSAAWEACPFSWVVRADPADIAASFLEPSGAPLFRIDLAKEAPEFPRVLPSDESHGWYSPEVRRRER